MVCVRPQCFEGARGREMVRPCPVTGPVDLAELAWLAAAIAGVTVRLTSCFMVVPSEANDLIFQYVDGFTKNKPSVFIKLTAFRASGK